MPIETPEHNAPGAEQLHSTTESHVIDIQHVSFKYDQEYALKNITCTIRKGDYVGVLGPNGSGKTTLLKLILGLLEPQEGTILVLGKDIHRTNQKTKIGYVPQRISQSLQQFPATVEEVVQSGRTATNGFFHRLNAQDNKIVFESMERTGVTAFRHRLISDLSGGQRQRVFIARALACEPQILILDEPTAGIDITSQEAFYKVLQELNTTTGLTILLVSHDIDVIMGEVNSLICVNQSLVYHGDPAHFLTKEHLSQLYGKQVTMLAHRISGGNS